MASHDSWIDAEELASLAGKFAPPPPPAPIEEALEEPPAPESYSLLPPALDTEPPLVVQPDADVEIITQRKPIASATEPVDITDEEESAGASPQVVALWSRKLSEIKQRARSNGLLISKGSPPPVPAAKKSPAFRAPMGSTTEKLYALSQWLSASFSNCEFFACDDWGNELLPGGNATPELAAAALTLSHAACLAGQKSGADIPAFLCTDLGAGLLTVFPSVQSAGRRFLAAVSESPLDLDTARSVSAAFRSVI
jgi:hypothetical protein